MITNHINGSGINTQSLPVSPVPQKTQTQTQSRAPTPVAEPQQNMGSEQDVKQAVKQIEQVVSNLARNLQFSIDDDTGKTIVKILDAQTQEVIRQFPTEDAISIARALDRVQGLLFNDKA
ncbi:MAG: flagellar protein FlaG [Nitrosomonas sp.]|nr:flagellar protein FlaG [Nitrosomonas sp.]